MPKKKSALHPAREPGLGLWKIFSRSQKANRRIQWTQTEQGMEELFHRGWRVQGAKRNRQLAGLLARSLALERLLRDRAQDLEADIRRAEEDYRPYFEPKKRELGRLIGKNRGWRALVRRILEEPGLEKEHREGMALGKILALHPELATEAEKKLLAENTMQGDARKKRMQALRGFLSGKTPAQIKKEFGFAEGEIQKIENALRKKKSFLNSLGKKKAGGGTFGKFLTTGDLSGFHKSRMDFYSQQGLPGLEQALWDFELQLPALKGTERNWKMMDLNALRDDLGNRITHLDAMKEKMSPAERENARQEKETLNLLLEGIAELRKKLK